MRWKRFRAAADPTAIAVAAMIFYFSHNTMLVRLGCSLEPLPSIREYHALWNKKTKMSSYISNQNQTKKIMFLNRGPPTPPIAVYKIFKRIKVWHGICCEKYTLYICVFQFNGSPSSTLLYYIPFEIPICHPTGQITIHIHTHFTVAHSTLKRPTIYRYECKRNITRLRCL